MIFLLLDHYSAGEKDAGTVAEPRRVRMTDNLITVELHERQTRCRSDNLPMQRFNQSVPHVHESNPQPSAKRRRVSSGSTLRTASLTTMISRLRARDMPT